MNFYAQQMPPFAPPPARRLGTAEGPESRPTGGAQARTGSPPPRSGKTSSPQPRPPARGHGNPGRRLPAETHQPRGRGAPAGAKCRLCICQRARVGWHQAARPAAPGAATAHKSLPVHTALQQAWARRPLDSLARGPCGSPAGAPQGRGQGAGGGSMQSLGPGSGASPALLSREASAREPAEPGARLPGH